MHKTLKIMAAGTAVFLTSIAGFVAYLAWELRDRPPASELPALVRDLPGPLIPNARSAFQRRVRAQFPDGMAAVALSDNLRQKGFHVRDDRASGLTIAVLEEQGAICAKTWIVSWRPDLQGRARNIDGHFNLGCL